MTAYSFKKRFVEPIRTGLLVVDAWGVDARWVPKRQTIRKDRKRHARPGEVVQLYCAQRTRQCFKIGEARCLSVQPIAIHFRRHRRRDWVEITLAPWTREKIDRPSQLNTFAQADGFASWEHLRDFWREEHPGVEDFEGVIIKWEPLP